MIILSVFILLEIQRRIQTNPQRRKETQTPHTHKAMHFLAELSMYLSNMLFCVTEFPLKGMFAVSGLLLRLSPLELAIDIVM